MPENVLVKGQHYMELMLKARMLDAMMVKVVDGAQKGYRDGTLRLMDVEDILEVAVDMFERERKQKKLESLKPQEPDADDF